MQFFAAAIVLLSGLATTVLAYPTKTMEIDGVTMELITDPALIFTGAPVNVDTTSMKALAWPVTCGAVGDLAGYSPASMGPINDGINYLLQQGTCTFAADSITRVSCSYSSGIFVQNRETHSVTEECGNFALDASAILSACWNNSGVIGRWGTSYHSGNTHIRKADC